MGSAVVCSGETTDRRRRRTVRVSWMDLWQSEVERTCTAECRQRIDGSRDCVLQQRCSSVKCTWQGATVRTHCPVARQMYSWLVVNARYLRWLILLPTRDERTEPTKCTAADSEIGTETFEEDVVVSGVECGRNVQWQQNSRLSITRWCDNVVDDLQQRRFSRMSKTVSRLTLAEPSCRHHMWPQVMHRQPLKYLVHRAQVGDQPVVCHAKLAKSWLLQQRCDLV